MEMAVARMAFIKGYFSTNDRQKKTEVAYMLDTSQFELFIGAQTNVKSISGRHIENWAEDLKGKGYSPASIKRKIVSLKVFFSYWLRSGLLTESPFWRIKISIGKVLQLPRTLTDDEIRRLLRQVHRHCLIRSSAETRHLASSKDFLSLRNKAVLELLFATGVRVGELSSIDIADYTSSEAAFRIRGKGRRERMAFIVDRKTAAIQSEYLNARLKIDTECEALFVNALGSRLSPQGIANIVRLLRKECGIQRNVTPHMLRHTVATMLLKNGVDIRVVQEFLGHASIATTQRYTHISKDHLVSELQARHPSLAIKRG
ncbi:MAG: tyrosine-type recombinase/integrase [Pyrinomonadaceae bacterium]